MSRDEFTIGPYVFQQFATPRTRDEMTRWLSWLIASAPSSLNSSRGIGAKRLPSSEPCELCSSGPLCVNDSREPWDDGPPSQVAPEIDTGIGLVQLDISGPGPCCSSIPWALQSLT